MADREYRSDQIMLTLALLAYRGFWDPDPANRNRVAALIRAGLVELEPLGGRWELCWGPATFRYLGSLFDDSLMYVVRSTTQDNQYAVVIRGTNAVAATDWVLGDLLAGYQLPWRPGGRAPTPAARVSLSMALGLKILLSMRAVSQPGLERQSLIPDVLKDIGEAAWTNGFSAWRSLRDGFARGFFNRRLGRALADIRDAMPELGLDPSEGNVDARLDTLLGRSKAIGYLVESLGEGVLDLLVPRLQEAGIRLGRAASVGPGLLELLEGIVEQHPGGPDITLTGHSKGGALAPVLALFLADTQGTDAVAPAYRWDPSGAARIHCYSFAGPTPGNAAFARHCNDAIGERCFRIANTLDFVTHAWLPERLREVAGIYAPSVKPPPGLDALLDLVAEQVEPLDYGHVGKHVTEYPGALYPSVGLFLEQEIFQHVQGYIDALELSGVVDVRDLIADWKALP